MLLVSNSRRLSVFVPNLFVLLTGAMLVTAVFGALAKPSLGAAFGVLVAFAFFAFVLSMIVVARARGDRLVARPLFGSETSCGLDEASIGFRASMGSRGAMEYRVQANDGMRTIELATAWTRRGANRDVRRLVRAFGIDDSPARAPGRDALKASLDAWDRQQAEVRARMAAAYASPKTWKQAALVVLVMVVAYGIVLAIAIANR